jgi:3-methyladenine DNA glycosylase AlkD
MIVPSKPSAAVAALAALQEHANPDHALVVQRYFKTGPGEYAEGDCFLGIRVPVLRQIARQHRQLELGESLELLHSPYHEARLLALVIMVSSYNKADAKGKQAIHDAYLANTSYVNNWDLVDVSASVIVGRHLEDGSRALLTRLARSKSVWERRIAIVATYHFIRLSDFQDALRISRVLLEDTHDLIHKAVGWMLREVGKRDQQVLEEFLEENYERMPRTMLRYAIERLPERRRRQFLAGTA